jgi:hypothetical protein
VIDVKLCCVRMVVSVFKLITGLLSVAYVGSITLEDCCYFCVDLASPPVVIDNVPLSSLLPEFCRLPREIDICAPNKPKQLGWCEI